MQVVCTSDNCDFIISSKCVFYEGASLPYSGIVTNDTVETVIQKLSDAIESGGGGTVTSVTATSPIISSEGNTPNLSIPVATSSTDGYLSATNWNTFNNKQDAISLTTTGTSGAATFVANVLNIPQYLGGSTGSIDNTVLRANGTGGSTVQATSLWTISDFGNVTIGTGSAITQYFIDTDGTATDVDLRLRAKRASAPGAFTQFYINGSSDSLGMTNGLELIDFVFTSGLVHVASAAALTIEAQSGDLILESEDNMYLSPTDTGNIGMFTSSGSFGSGEGVIFIDNATTNATTSPTSGIILHSRDSSDANATLALYTEQAPEATATFTQTHRLKVWINNVEYWLSLDAV